MPLDAALHLAEQNRSRYGRRMYLMRAVGLGLGAICVAAVLHEHGASPALWGLLVAHGFAWPHLAYVRVRANREDPLQTAIREFTEETSFVPTGPFLSLGRITQRSGKLVYAWAFEGDCDPSLISSVRTTTEWPPRSGRLIEIPEIDRVAFFSLEDARRAINVAQAELVDRLEQLLAI